MTMPAVPPVNFDELQNFPSSLTSLTDSTAIVHMVDLPESSPNSGKISIADLFAANGAVLGLIQENLTGIPTSASTSNTDYNLALLANNTTGSQEVFVDGASFILYNPSTGKLTVITLSAEIGTNGTVYNPIAGATDYLNHTLSALYNNQSAYLLASNNLSDLTDLAAALANLGASGASVANALGLRDSYANISFNNTFNAFNSTVSAAGTTAMSVSSAKTQVLTGTNIQINQLPSATTIPLGGSYFFKNDSALDWYVSNYSGEVGSTMSFKLGAIGIVFLKANTTPNGEWDVMYGVPSDVAWGTGLLSAPDTDATFKSITASNINFGDYTFSGNQMSVPLNSNMNQQVTGTGNLNLLAAPTGNVQLLNASFPTKGAKFDISLLTTGIQTITILNSADLVIASFSSNADALDGVSSAEMVTPYNLNKSGCLAQYKATAYISGIFSGGLSNGALTLPSGPSAAYTNGLSANGATGVNLTLSRQFKVTCCLNTTVEIAATALFTITGSGCTVSTIARGSPVPITKDILLEAIVTTTTGSPVITVVASGILGVVSIANDSFLNIVEL